MKPLRLQGLLESISIYPSPPNIHFLKDALSSSSQPISCISFVFLGQVCEIQVSIGLITQTAKFKLGIYKCPAE